MAKRTAIVSKARGAGFRLPTVAAGVVVLIIAVVVVVGVLSSSNEAEQRPIPAAPAPASYPTEVAGAAVVAGRPAAHTLDVWEDALCPACGRFEEQTGDPIAQALAAGRLQVRYHLVNLLDEKSRPAGYSTLAGNALMCAAENGAFPAMHKSLFAAQPEELGAGYTTEQLVDLGQRVGAGPGYAPCVTGNTHAAQIADTMARAAVDPALARESGGSTGFGTPTIVLDGRLLSDSLAPLAPLLGG